MQLWWAEETIFYKIKTSTTKPLNSLCIVYLKKKKVEKMSKYRFFKTQSKQIYAALLLQYLIVFDILTRKQDKNTH